MILVAVPPAYAVGRTNDALLKNATSETIDSIGASNLFTHSSPAWISRVKEDSEGPDKNAINPIRSILSLAVVLGVLLGLQFYLRRKFIAAPAIGQRQAGALVIESRKKLGARQEIVTVLFGDKRLLLGVTPDHITCLEKEPHKRLSSERGSKTVAMAEMVNAEQGKTG